MARTLLYQFLARAFEDPTAEIWQWLTDTRNHSALQSAARTLADAFPSLGESAANLAAQLQIDRLESFQTAYVTAFGHTARGDCPLNEIEYGDLNADPLFQPHRLADLAAFYCAFGMEIADGAAERPDHLAIELEFMSVLAAKEAFALEHQLDEDLCALGREAQRKFLCEHLGRWTPALMRRLARATSDAALAALAEFARDFVTAECARYGVSPGSQDLHLRPVDEAAERLCDSCKLGALLPGAT